MVHRSLRTPDLSGTALRVSAAKPERSAAQGVRDSNTTGLPCGLLCFTDTGRRPLANEPGILDRDMLIGTADQTRLMAIRVV